MSIQNLIKLNKIKIHLIIIKFKLNFLNFFIVVVLLNNNNFKNKCCINIKNYYYLFYFFEYLDIVFY